MSTHITSSSRAPWASAKRTPPAPPFPLAKGRFLVEAEIGRGGMGVVYVAYDRELDDRVALKTVIAVDAHDLAALRNEFRIVRSLHHPNLVPPLELFEEGDWTYFTMPLVSGPHFDDAVSEAGETPDARIARVRELLPGILDGLQTIHANELLHGDVKPGNILVFGNRPILLDFGMSRRLDSRDQSESGGTLSYLAPEALYGASEPASDIYSLGVTLYFSLCGQFPHADYQARESGRFEPLTNILPGVPTAVADAIHACLGRNPSDRPTLRALADRFGVELPRAALPMRVAFMDRVRELEALHAAQARTQLGGAVAAHVHGLKGYGKTALVDEFVLQLRGKALTIRGQCDHGDWTNYNALTMALDELVRLTEYVLPPGTLDSVAPVDLDLASALFNTFRQIPHTPTALPPGTGEEQRVRGVAALRRILGCVTSKTPLVVVLDNYQWATPDSVSLLVDLASGADAPPVLWLVVTRDVDDAPSWTPPGVLSCVDVPVGPVDDGTMRALCTRLFPDQSDLEELLRESQGSPQIAVWMARHRHSTTFGLTASNVHEDILAALAALSPEARAVVELLCVAESDLKRTTVLHAARLPAKHLPILVALEHEGWIFASDLQAQRVRIYSGPVIDAVTRSLSEDVKRALHDVLHETLRAEGAAASALFRFALGARKISQAHAHAIQAAADASADLAFADAAAWFGRAIDLDADVEPRWDLWRRRAEALVHGGHSIEAADAYLEAAKCIDIADPEERTRRVVRMKTDAATQLVRCGAFDRGDALFAETLAHFGESLPGDDVRTQLEGARHRLATIAFGWRFKPSDKPVDADVVEHLETLRKAAFAYGISRQVRADTLNLRLLRSAVRARASVSAAYGYGYEATVESALGTRFLDGRARKMLDVAAALAGDRAEFKPYLLGARTSMAWSTGEWSTCRDAAIDGEASYRQHTLGTRYEIGIVRTFLVSALWWSGDFANLQSAVSPWLDEARDLKDALYVNTFRLGESSSRHLVADDPNRVLADAADASREWRADEVSTQRYLRFHGLLRALMYMGDLDAARVEIDREWPVMKGALFTQFVMTGSILQMTRGHVANSIAAVSGATERKRWLRDARDCAKAVRAKTTNVAREPMADIVLAGALRLEGRDEESITMLRRAAAGFDRAQMASYAACARAVDPDPIVSAEGYKWLTAAGVVNPKAFLRAMAPGWPDRQAALPQS